MEQTTRTRAAITGLDMSCIIVRDPAAQIAFYRDVLGIAPTDVDEQGRGAEFTLADGQTFGVWNPGDGSLTPGGGMIFFAVEDARDAVARIRERGGELSDPIEGPACIMAFGADPDGNGFVIHQRKVRDDERPAQAEHDSASIVGIDITGFFAGDPARSIAFYRDVLGMTPTHVDKEGRGAEFTLSDGSTFGVWNPGGDSPAASGSGMFAVGDAQAAVARIRARGGSVSDPTETPVCFMAFGADPEGHGFIIHQRKA